MRTNRKSLTRRKVLEYAGGALAGVGALGGKRASAADPPSAVTVRMAEYMAAAGTKALPADAVERAKHHILDTFAAMISW